jgi:hypothetical protein
MIPDFVDGKILAPGLHLCTFDEVLERFGKGARREHLCRELRELASRAAGCSFLGLIIWGSFPTACADPGDLDLMFITRPGISKESLPPECAQLLESDRSRERFGHDFLSCTDDPVVIGYLSRHLGYDNRTDKEKGMLRLKL